MHIADFANEVHPPAFKFKVYLGHETLDIIDKKDWIDARNLTPEAVAREAARGFVSDRKAESLYIPDTIYVLMVSEQVFPNSQHYNLEYTSFRITLPTMKCN